MRRNDPNTQMRHMLDHAREAVALLAGKEKADLSQNRILELAFKDVNLYQLAFH